MRASIRRADLATDAPGRAGAAALAAAIAGALGLRPLGLLIPGQSRATLARTLAFLGWRSILRNRGQHIARSADRLIRVAAFLGQRELARFQLGASTGGQSCHRQVSSSIRNAGLVPAIPVARSAAAQRSRRCQAFRSQPIEPDRSRSETDRDALRQRGRPPATQGRAGRFPRRRSRRPSSTRSIVT